jgi:hypothetical protein
VASLAVARLDVGPRSDVLAFAARDLPDSILCDLLRLTVLLAAEGPGARIERGSKGE